MNDTTRNMLDRQIREILDELRIWRHWMDMLESDPAYGPPSDRVLACIADLKLELRSRLVRWADLAG